MKRTATAFAAMILAAPGFGASWQYWTGLGSSNSLLEGDNWNMTMDGTGASGTRPDSSTVLAFINVGNSEITVPEDFDSNSFVISGDSHLKLTVAPGKVFDWKAKNLNIGYFANGYPDESYPKGTGGEFDPDARPSIEITGVVSNVYPRIGSNPDLNGADMTVSGAGTILHASKPSGKTYHMLVGMHKGGVSLTVKDGARLVCDQPLEIGGGDIGSDQTNAHNNVMTVTDATLEIPQGMNVGNMTTNNLAVIKSSSVLVARGNNDSYFSAVGYASGADWNRLVLDGTVWGGSEVASRQKFQIGRGGTFCNVAVVTNGSQMYVSELSCGYSGSSNRLEVSGCSFLWTRGRMELSRAESSGWNSVDVSGAGTVLSNTYTSVYVGYNGRCSTMSVRGGATWYNERTLNIGLKDTSTADTVARGTNLVDISGVGTTAFVSNMVYMADADQVLRVRDGAKLTVSRDGSGSGAGQGSLLGCGANASVSNRIEVLNGGEFMLTSRGSLTIGNNAIASGCGLLVDNAVASLGQNVIVGNYASDNFMEVRNGSFCAFTTLYLGYRAVSSNNVVVVAGEGTVMTNRDHNVYVGYQGHGSRLVVEDGAKFGVAKDLFVAADANSSSTASNSVVIVRSGGKLAVAGTSGSNNNGNGIILSGTWDAGSRPDGTKLIADGGEITTDQAIVLRNGSEFIVKGSSNTVEVAQFRAVDSATLTYVADQDGFSTITVRSTAGQKTAKCAFATAGTYLVIDATAYARAGGGTQTLIDSEVNLSAGFQAAVNNGKVTLMPEGTEIDFPDSKKLVVRVPSRIPGFMILIR